MPGRKAKRIASTTSINSRSRKRVNRATSNGPSRAEVGTDDDDAGSDAESKSNKSGSTREGDDMEQLERQLAEDRKNWRSPMYSFFDPAVSLEKDGRRVYQVFTCAAKDCKGIVKRFQDSKDASSTSNLKRHAEGCFGKAVVKAVVDKEMTGPQSEVAAALARRGLPPMPLFNGVNTNLELRANIAKWVSQCNRPAEIVWDIPLQYMFAAAWPNLTPPCPNTVRRDVKVIYERCRERITKMLQDHAGRIHFGTDAWTSTNHHALVAWTAHFEREGFMKTFLLDIVEVAESHTGLALANAFQTMLESHELEKKVLAAIADNATSNDTQRTHLAAMDNSFEEENHVRCFNHTLQLSAKALMAPFHPALGKVSDIASGNQSHLNVGGEDDEENKQKDDPVIYDVADDNIDELNALEPESREALMNGAGVIRATISKLRDLSFSIIRSTTGALPRWDEYCEKCELEPRRFPRDVVTRWNSTYDMLSFAVKYRAVIDAMTTDKTMKFRKLELEDEEWLIIEDLVDILSIYKAATLYFSKDSASVAMVIPSMDRLTNFLNEKTEQPYHPTIAAAIKLARNKMNRYYSMTDDSRIYRIAMVLHPEYKLEYFREQEWPDRWIKMAKDLVYQEYGNHYKKRTTTRIEPTRKEPTKGFIPFGRRSITARPHVDELQQYLNTPLVKVGDDDEAPLRWWMKNKDVYPNLHRMALDYLSIPATSTAVERVFSQGRQILPFTRNSLLPSSIKAFLCVGSWARCGIIGLDDVLAALSGTETASVVTSESTSSAVTSNGTPSVGPSVEV